MSNGKNRFPKVLQKGLLSAVERIATPSIQKRWAKYLIVGLFGISIFQAISIAWLIPSKEFIPYFLVEQTDGSLNVSKKIGKRFVASEVNKSYFLRKFINSLLIIDEQTRFRLPEGANFLKGAAVTQWKQFVNEIDRPLAKMLADPTLRRSVEYEGQLDYLASDDISGTVTAFLVIRTIGAKNSTVKRIKMRLDFAILPIADSETIVKNPLGLYITNFGMENVK